MWHRVPKHPHTRDLLKALKYLLGHVGPPEDPKLAALLMSPHTSAGLHARASLSSSSSSGGRRAGCSCTVPAAAAAVPPMVLDDCSTATAVENNTFTAWNNGVSALANQMANGAKNARCGRVTLTNGLPKYSSEVRYSANRRIYQRLSYIGIVS